MGVYERPWVLHFSTMSVDGRIASSTRYSLLSCIYDKTRLLILRGMVDAVMVGAGTVKADNPRLVRRVGGGRRYLRVVVDCRARLDPGMRVFDVSEAPTVLVACRGAPRERLEGFRARGVELLLVGRRGGGADLAEALRLLRELYGVERLLVEGGGVLAHSLHRERLVDELRVTVAPVLFAAGRSLVDDPGGVGFPDWGSSPRLRLAAWEPCPCGNCMHLVYDVLDARCCPAAPPPPRLLNTLILEALGASAASGRGPLRGTAGLG